MMIFLIDENDILKLCTMMNFNKKCQKYKLIIKIKLLHFNI